MVGGSWVVIIIDIDIDIALSIYWIIESALGEAYLQLQLIDQSSSDIDNPDLSDRDIIIIIIQLGWCIYLVYKYVKIIAALFTLLLVAVSFVLCALCDLEVPVCRSYNTWL